MLDIIKYSISENVIHIICIRCQNHPSIKLTINSSACTAVVMFSALLLVSIELGYDELKRGKRSIITITQYHLYLLTCAAPICIMHIGTTSIKALRASNWYCPRTTLRFFFSSAYAYNTQNYWSASCVAASLNLKSARTREMQFLVRFLLISIIPYTRISYIYM